LSGAYPLLNTNNIGFAGLLKVPCGDDTGRRLIGDTRMLYLQNNPCTVKEMFWYSKLS
jgi:hypothetical protein